MPNPKKDGSRTFFFLYCFNCASLVAPRTRKAFFVQNTKLSLFSKWIPGSRKTIVGSVGLCNACLPAHKDVLNFPRTLSFAMCWNAQLAYQTGDTFVWIRVHRVACTSTCTDCGSLRHRFSFSSHHPRPQQPYQFGLTWLGQTSPFRTYSVPSS